LKTDEWEIQGGRRKVKREREREKDGAGEVIARRVCKLAIL